MPKEKDISQFIDSIDVNDKIVRESKIMDENTKDAFLKMSNSTRDILDKHPKMTSYGLLSLKSELLTYWNESINPDTEIFWLELKTKGVEYERKEPLKFALEKNYFRRVEQGIDARKYWDNLKTQNSIIERFSGQEIERITATIKEDEKKRFLILRKCLDKNSIPKTQYLKFGECMAYFGQCGLFEKYFTDKEVKSLYEIWKNFK